MHFSGNNDIGDVSLTTLNGLLREVTRVITNPKSNGNFNYENQSSSDTRQRKSSNPRRKDERSENNPMPIYTNYWLSQEHPDYVDQEEGDPILTRHRRKTSVTPAEGVKDYLDNCLSTDSDLRRTIQERIPDLMTERTMYGAPLPMVPEEDTLAKIAISMADPSYFVSSKRSRRKTDNSMNTYRGEYNL